MTAPKPAASTPATPSEPTTPPVMSEADRQELAELRADREKREHEELEAERQRKLAAEKAEIDPRTGKKLPYWHSWSVEDQIKDHYMRARGTIQDYARIYKLTVEEVLHILGHDEMISIETIGDLVDKKELGPNADPNPRGQLAEANYSVN